MATLRYRRGPGCLPTPSVSVPATLFEPSEATEAGQREGWRRLWLGTDTTPRDPDSKPRCREKLDPGATITMEALRASDEDGRSQGSDARRAAAFKTLVDTGMDRDEARRVAGLEG